MAETVGAAGEDDFVAWQGAEADGARHWLRASFLRRAEYAQQRGRASKRTSRSGEEEEASEASARPWARGQGALVTQRLVKFNKLVKRMQDLKTRGRVVPPRRCARRGSGQPLKAPPFCQPRKCAPEQWLEYVSCSPSFALGVYRVTFARWKAWCSMTAHNVGGLARGKANSSWQLVKTWASIMAGGLWNCTDTQGQGREARMG